MALFRAVSLRKLTGYNSSYSGACIRVQRSSDNTQQDIGFVSGSLDTSSLLTFVGAGTGYVVKWYDQSGNAHDWVADGGSTTTANFPVIVQSGTLVTVNSKPAVRAAAGQNLTSSAGICVQPLTTLAVWSLDDVTLDPGGAGVALISGGANYSGAYWLGTNGQTDRNGAQMVAIRGFEATLHGVTAATNGKNFAGGFQGTTGFAYSIYRNGALDSSGTGANSTTMVNNGTAMLFTTAGTGSGLNWPGGTCQEIIEWNTANSDTTNEANSLDQYNAWVSSNASNTVGVTATTSTTVAPAKRALQSVAVTATTSTTVNASKNANQHFQTVLASAVTSTSAIANKILAAAQWSTTALNGSSMVFSFGNIQASWNGTDGNVQSVTSHATARWYAEVTWNSLSTSGDISVDNAADSRYCHVDNTGLVRRRRDGTIIADDNNPQLAYTVGQTVCIACDPGNQMVYWRINNGPWNGNRSADPVGGTGGYPVPIDPGEALFVKAALKNGAQVTINTGILGFTYPVPQGYTGWSNTLNAKTVAVNCTGGTVVSKVLSKLQSVLATCTSTTQVTAGIAKFITVAAACLSSIGMRKAVNKTVAVASFANTAWQETLNHITLGYNETLSAIIRGVVAIGKQTTYLPSGTPSQAPSSFYTGGNNRARGPSVTVDNTTAPPANKPTLSSFYQGGSNYS